jgi:hypothetical protein
MLQRSPNPTQASQDTRAPIASAPGAGSRGGMVPMLEISIQRLEEIVEQETVALQTRQAVNLKEFNDRKSQALLELTRSLRNLGASGPPQSPTLAARVGSLKAKLATNQAVLKVHLEAVREISTTLADAIRHAESDGTYSQATVRRS